MNGYPDLNYFGQDSFTYQVSDGLMTSGPVTVTLAVNELIPHGYAGTALAVGDFLGNGNQDFAEANTGTNTISVFLGNGNGTFTQQSDITLSGQVTALASGDFNGDGKADLAAVLSGSNQLVILLSNGIGSFTAEQTLTVGSSPSAVAVGDFYGDGIQDLAVTNSGSGTVSILVNNGSGTFTTGQTLTVGISPSSVVVGDFNGDGHQDLAVTNSGDGTVSVLLGKGGGTFQTATSYAVGGSPATIGVGDFNGDGLLDLAVAESESNTVLILQGIGAGQFSLANTYLVGNTPISLMAGDFNADGVDDLAIGEEGSAVIQILYSDYGEMSWGDPITIPGGVEASAEINAAPNMLGFLAAPVVAGPVVFRAPVAAPAAKAAAKTEYNSQVAISPDGKTLAVADSEGTLKAYTLAGLAKVFSITDKGYRFDSVSFSPLGKTIYTMEHEKGKPNISVMKIWNATTGAAIATISLKNGVGPKYAVSSDGMLLVTATSTALIPWNPAAPRTPLLNPAVNRIGPKRVGEKISAIAFSGEGKMMAVGIGSGITMYDWSKFSAGGDAVYPTVGKRWSFGNTLPNPEVVAISNDAGIVAAGFHNQAFYQLVIGGKKQTIPLVKAGRVSDAWPNGMVFSKDGKWLAIVSSATLAGGKKGGSLVLMNLSNPTKSSGSLGTFSGKAITSVAFSSDNKNLVIGLSDGSVRIYPMTKTGITTKGMGTIEPGK